MRLTTKTIITSFILIDSLFLWACTNGPKNKIAEKYLWKYATGYYAGDCLEFSNGTIYTVDEEDSIRKDGKVVGVVTKINEDQMEISSLQGQKGVYRSIELIKKKARR